MESLIKSLLIVHISCGTLALFAAPVSIIATKGSNIHNLFGRIFFWCMTIVFVTAVIISIYKVIPFLLFIAFFSYYNIVAAYRILHLKGLHENQRPKPYDWGIAATGSLFNLCLIVYSIVLFLDYGLNDFAILSAVFGIGGMFNVYRNTRLFIVKPRDPRFWLRYHLGNMLGGFIAAVTAFSVNTISFLPTVGQWLWPAALGVPLIIFFVRKFKASHA